MEVKRRVSGDLLISASAPAYVEVWSLQHGEWPVSGMNSMSSLRCI